MVFALKLLFYIPHSLTKSSCLYWQRLSCSFFALFHLQQLLQMWLEYKKIIIITMVMVFVIGQDYWLQVKKMQFRLAFSKKEFEGKLEQSAHGKGRKQLDFRNMGTKESKATGTLSPFLISVSGGYFILALPPIVS